MKKGTPVMVRMPNGKPRTGKFLRTETNQGAWLVIKEDISGAEFKARPKSVTETQ